VIQGSAIDGSYSSDYYLEVASLLPSDPSDEAPPYPNKYKTPTSS
jgi:hypothetical protein